MDHFLQSCSNPGVRRLRTANVTQLKPGRRMARGKEKRTEEDESGRLALGVVQAMNEGGLPALDRASAQAASEGWRLLTWNFRALLSWSTLRSFIIEALVV